MIRLEVAGVARVLVTGSRRGTSRDDVRATLDAVHAELPLDTLMVVIHGDAQEGADRYAREWALEHVGAGVIQEPHLADWDGPAGRGAGYARNAEMVRLGADLCLTFIARCGCRDPHRPRPHGTHGSVHCATEAARAGIPVRHVRPGG